MVKLLLFLLRMICFLAACYLAYALIVGKVSVFAGSTILVTAVIAFFWNLRIRETWVTEWFVPAPAMFGLFLSTIGIAVATIVFSIPAESVSPVPTETLRTSTYTGAPSLSSQPVESPAPTSAPASSTVKPAPNPPSNSQVPSQAPTPPPPPAPAPPAPPTATPQQDGTSARIGTIEQSVVSEANNERARRKISPVTWDIKLGQIAKSHSENMAQKKELFHSAMSEPYAENVWMATASPGFFDNADLAKIIVSNWMSSPYHKTWLLCPNLKHVGVGMVEVGNSIYATWSFWRAETDFRTDWWYVNGAKQPPAWMTP